MRSAAGTVHVFTFKEGVLARAAHDLRFRLEEFAIELAGETLTGTFALESLKLDGPVLAGTVSADAYDAAQRADVERTMHRAILQTMDHPVARFTGRAVGQPTGFAVSGHFTLVGRTAPLSFDVTADHSTDPGTYRAHINLQPTLWGIAPYRALLGAIRLRDTVRVELALREA